MPTRAVPAALLLASLLLAGLVPVVSAQQDQVGQTSVGLSLPTLPRPVPPGTTQEFNITVRYQWNNGFSNEPTTIRLEVVDQPPWLNSTFSPQSFQVETAPRSSDINTTLVNLNITVAPDAPSFGEGVATYKVIAEENPPLQGSEATSEFEVTAGFEGRLSVSLPKGETVDANGGFITEVPLRVENAGNGPMLLEINVLRKPAEARITAPQDVVVGVEGDERVVVPALEVQVPWKVSEEGLVEVEIVPTHAQRGVRGQTSQVSFQLEGDSAIPVPGPGPLALPALLAVALLLARRGRQRST